jgi:hypothetical protein
MSVATTAFADDRATLASGMRSCIWTPMRFGDEIGAALFFIRQAGALLARRGCGGRDGHLDPHGLEGAIS